MNERARRPAGFTILEIVLTLVLLGVVGALMAPYYGAGVMTSSTALFRVQDTVQLEAVMENILSHYKYSCAASAPSCEHDDKNTSCVATELATTLAAIHTNVTSNLAVYNPSSYGVTATAVSGQLYSKASPAMDIGFDQNCSLTITLTHTDTNQALSYVFVEGTNYNE
jgi:type II secretory pathway pseudopilin PulG